MRVSETRRHIVQPQVGHVSLINLGCGGKSIRVVRSKTIMVLLMSWDLGIGTFCISSLSLFIF